VKKYILILLLMAFTLVACGDENLPEDYVIVDSKVLAVKIDEPEAAPGDDIAMRILVAGNDVDQNSDATVQWVIAGNIGALQTSPYNGELILTLPNDMLADEISVDVPVIARVTLGDKTLTAEKLFRVTNNPVGKNPVISGVELHWLTDAGIQTRTLSYGDSFNPGLAANIACTSITEELTNNGNEKLVYQWYLTKESGTGREIEINDSKDDIEALLGKGAKAAEFRESVVYGTNSRSSSFSVYLVVRDNTENATESSQDRLGTDYFHFTITAD